jgi:hypothetical protein
MTVERATRITVSAMKLIMLNNNKALFYTIKILLVTQ